MNPSRGNKKKARLSKGGKNTMYKIAQREDLTKLANYLSREDIDKSFVKPLSERTTTISKRVLDKYLTGQWVVALDEKEEIIGCCALYRNKNEVEVSTFVVSPDQRGKGIGGRLLDEVLDIARMRHPHQPVMLDSWEGSSIGSMCERKGFKLVDSFEDPDKRPPGVKTVLYRLQQNDPQVHHYD